MDVIAPQGIANKLGHYEAKQQSGGRLSLLFCFLSPYPTSLNLISNLIC